MIPKTNTERKYTTNKGLSITKSVTEFLVKMVNSF